jgi:two-component system response regulator DevR
MDVATAHRRPIAVPSTVYLVDSHELVRRGIRHLLERDGLEVVGESGGVGAALGHILDLRPDLVILDWCLSDGSGIELCRDIRAANPRIRCLVLTERHDERTLVLSVQAGADGYVLKGMPGVDLVSAISRVALGHTLVSAELRARASAADERSFAPAPSVAGLTSQEQKVLAHLADGLTNRQIAQQMHLTEKTVRNYVSIVLAKLGFEHRTQAAIFVSRTALYRHELAG